MPTIKDVLYVRFRVTDLQAQKQFLEDFGFRTKLEGDLLMGRGTGDRPYIYLAQEADEPGFVCVGFAAESADALQEIAAIDQVPVEANPLEGGGLIARLTDPNGFSVDVVANISAAPSLATGGRSSLNSGNKKQRLGERVAFVDPECSIKRLGHVVLMVKNFQ